MKIKIMFRVTMAVFISAFLISFSSFSGTEARADQPIIITGGGDYEVNSILFGFLDLSGERSVSMAYVEKDPDDGKGVAQLKHEDRKMTLDLICMLDDFADEHGFYSVVGNVRKVKGYTEGDILFPKFAAPEIGDYVIVAFRLSEEQSGDSLSADEVTVPFLFPPVFNGIPVNCQTLVSPLGPPLSIFDLTIGVLDGVISLKGL